MSTSSTRCGPGRPASWSKFTDAAELIRAVRVIAAGEGLLSPGVTRRLIAEFAARARSPQPARALDELTAREREVVGLVAAGLSNDDIARRLYVSQSTVKTHVARAMLKLAARDRAQLVVPPTSPAWLARAGPAPRSQTRKPVLSNGPCPPRPPSSPPHQQEHPTQPQLLIEHTYR